MALEHKATVYAELDRKRERAFDEAKQRELELEKNIPGLAELNRAISGIGPRLLALGVAGGADFQSKSDALYEEHESLVARKRALLEANGYAADYDSPLFECAVCRDTGYDGMRMCRCVKDAIVKHAYYSSGLGKALEEQTFDTLDMRYYSGTTESGNSVKDAMGYVVGYCQSYAKCFAPGNESLLMIGGAGRGKTHMASAIGKVVIEKGYSVVYENAANIVNTFEAERFGRGSETDTEKYYNCDLLIIDDLGTEFVTQYTLSVLFNLINHRIINKLSTVVTTNLSLKEIENNYKERIYSRLCGDYTILGFCGKDIRRLKKEAQ